MAISGYNILPLNPTVQEIRRVVNLLVDGKHNGVSNFTCAANATTTTVNDLRVGPESIVLLSPTCSHCSSYYIYLSSNYTHTFFLFHSYSSSTYLIGCSHVCTPVTIPLLLSLLLLFTYSLLPLSSPFPLSSSFSFSSLSSFAQGPGVG